MNGRPERYPPRCTAEDKGGVLVYRLAGNLHLDAKDLLAFDKPLAGFHAVVVDLTQVTYFGAITLNALLALRLRAEHLGMPVHLAGLPAEAARVLEITEATGLFQIHPTLDAALDHLARTE